MAIAWKPSASVVDPQTGCASREFFQYLQAQDRAIAAATSSPATTVAKLPANGAAGDRAFVTDATATTFLSVVVGGGTNKVPVVSNGTNWLIG